jgi:hypothetical protein
VTTIAGTGVPGFLDGAVAAAKFDNPTQVSTDANGNIFTAEGHNYNIRKIVPAGIVSSLAGNPSVFGYADGIGASALFTYPSGMDMDPYGNIIISEYGLSRIRKVSQSGVVTTIAGDGNTGVTDGPAMLARFDGSHGVAITATGIIYIADRNSSRIRKLTPQ